MRSFPLKRLLSNLLATLTEEEIGLSVLDYISEKYAHIARDKSTCRALWICTIHFLLIFVSLIVGKIAWSLNMLKNYIKIAFRHFFRNKGYSLLNLLGLSTGLLCCIFIFLYVRYEMSYDTHHEDVDRIYRITASYGTNTGINHYAGIAHQLTPHVRENLSESALIARITPLRDAQVGYGNRMFNEAGQDMPFVDADIIKILTFRFVSGDPNTALTRPNTTVLTVQTTRKYFGSDDPIGSVLHIGEEPYEVTGVIEDPPGNTIFPFKLLRSWSTLNPNMFYPRWLNFHWTMIKLAPGIQPQDFADMLTQIVMAQSDELQKNPRSYKVSLQPIQKVHLHSGDFIFERAHVGKRLYITLFSGIGLIILFIASFNFMNLITARASNRACEVGMRKVIGARRRQLFHQFIGESWLMTALAFGFAFMGVYTLLQPFNNLTGMKITYAALWNFDFILIMAAAMIVLGMAAGSYPAFFLSSFRPLSVLRGTVRMGVKGQNFRKILVIGQFTLSIAMIIGVLLFNRQLRYMKNRSLGFEVDQKLIINMQDVPFNPNKYRAIKEEFKNYASVLGAAFSTGIPGRTPFHARLWPSGQQNTNAHNVNWIDADGDFLPLYGLELIAGRNISDHEIRADMPYQAIINEAAVNIFGWTDPEEALTQTFRDDPNRSVVGVVKDFHYLGLQKPIEPLVIIIRGGFRYLTLKIQTENIGDSIAFIEATFKSLFPGKVFAYFFLDEDFDRQYRKEEQMAGVFGIFTFMGILIASLGLIALASFIAQQRTKEIGIRKIMGASSVSIMNMLTREFLYLVLGANLLAWPASYFLMQKWLQHFAFRIQIGIGPFLLASLLAVGIALISVSYQSLKAACANPADALRYE